MRSWAAPMIEMQEQIIKNKEDFFIVIFFVRVEVNQNIFLQSDKVTGSAYIGFA